MAAPPAMSSNHARSPVIKIIAGEDEIFDEENPDLPINVFHVSKSLLLENSKYFAIILDCSPERTTVRLPTSDHEVLADWLDLIYQGALTKSSSGEPMTFEDVERYFKFADLVGSEKLRNTIMDSMQDVPLDHWNLNSLLLLENEHSSSLGGLCDYVLECLAYKIVVGGWAEFIKQDRGGGDVIWRTFIRDTTNIDLLNRLLLKVDQLNEEKDHNRLVAPSVRKDCMWHEHASDDTKAKCPRNASPLWKGMLAYKDIVNGHGTQLEINGHERAGNLFVATT